MRQKSGDTWIVDTGLEVHENDNKSENLKEIWKYLVMSQTHGNYKIKSEKNLEILEY